MIENMGGEVNRNVKKFDVNRNKIWKQKQQAVRNEADRGIKENNNNKSFEEKFPPLWTKEQGNNKEKEKAMKRNNKFSVLGGIIDDDQQEINLLKDKMIVDKYLNLKLQPSSEEIKNRSQEVIKYFKRAWDTDREKEKNDILDGLEGIVEDVLEDESLAARKVIANEMNGSCSSLLN
ncbi:hypothetical protein Tco_0893232 [Tanacetum coccineum]|uniref:Uncharacterized protein n=1 Tax=Tanacetum coccineum TaxID=301880 RepID=A0ABQ5C892_9ASTR